MCVITVYAHYKLALHKCAHRRLNGIRRMLRRRRRPPLVDYSEQGSGGGHSTPSDAVAFERSLSAKFLPVAAAPSPSVLPSKTDFYEGKGRRPSPPPITGFSISFILCIAVEEDTVVFIGSPQNSSRFTIRLDQITSWPCIG